MPRLRRHAARHSSMMKTKKFVLVKQFEGEPRESDLKLVEEEVPPIKDGELLCEAVWFSIEPHMRQFVSRLPVGATMVSSQVAKIIESKAENFPVGKFIVGYLGWQLNSVVNTREKTMKTMAGLPPPYVLPDFGDLPLSLALGVLGVTGNTAYFGLLEVCDPKPGEVVVVSGAAGAVGSHVGQIARIKGCKVVGFAGSDDKVRWLKDVLKFDAAFNYKRKNLTAALVEAAPGGVDCYFDNVGGTLSSTVLAHMKHRGRVAVCGCISAYNNPKMMIQAPIVQPSVVFKELRMEGFLVTRWANRWMEAIQQNLQWIRDGELVYRESVTEGFENIPRAFIGMFRGDNMGKAVVRA